MNAKVGDLVLVAERGTYAIAVVTRVGDKTCSVDVRRGFVFSTERVSYDQLRPANWGVFTKLEVLKREARGFEDQANALHRTARELFEGVAEADCPPDVRDTLLAEHEEQERRLAEERRAHVLGA